MLSIVFQSGPRSTIILSFAKKALIIADRGLLYRSGRIGSSVRMDFALPYTPCIAAISRDHRTFEPRPFRPFSAYLAVFPRRPCHSPLWSVSGSVKSLVNMTSFA